MKTFKAGNILGDSRAESDKFLLQTFIPTSDYRALIETEDYNFIIGRRGTGKSALYLKCSEHFGDKTNKSIYLLNESINEYDSMGMQAEFETAGITDYKIIRAISRLIWNIFISIRVLEMLDSYWKKDKLDCADDIALVVNEHRKLIDSKSFLEYVRIVSKYLKEDVPFGQIPGRIAEDFRINDITNVVRHGLEETNHTVRFLFDGLDEGWVPSESATAILGGLAKAASDFAEDEYSRISVSIFIRDNIFRALSHFDPDFSRHIENNTLRLNWEEDALFQLITKRIKFSLNIDPKVESPLKIWNRFARKELKDKEGFRKCLQYTLRRPRDLLVLLNKAYQNASRAERECIIEDDIDQSAKQISISRLEDLQKEYSAVFPGVKHFIEPFKNWTYLNYYYDIVEKLDQAIKDCSFQNVTESDFEILGSGKDIFNALYSIGFFGIEVKNSGTYKFCYDGAEGNDLEIIEEQKVKACIHPCYWRALNISHDENSANILTDIYDEYESQPQNDIKDMRTQNAGKIINQLPHMEIGEIGTHDFEKWVLRTFKILFAGSLANPILTGFENSKNRHIQADIIDRKGFWSKIKNDFSCNGVLISIINYTSIKKEEFVELQNRLNENNCQLGIIVNRQENEGVSKESLEVIKEVWINNKKVILILPASMLQRCVRKLRNVERFDYCESQLNKLMDRYIKSYLKIPNIKSYSRKKRK